MVPRIILRKLRRLRRREALLRLTWGLARLLTLAFVLLACACLTDWLIDRYQETPWEIRLLLLGMQVVAAALALAYFLGVPLSRRPGYAELALRVEEKVPSLGHRLISAVQLNQPSAVTAGMSPELIAIVTKEAEARARKVRIRDVTDRRRLRWSAWLLGPALLIGGVLYLAWPATVEALLWRQLLADEDIPRSVYLTSAAPAVWYRPSGEEVVLRFHATGDGVNGELEGQVSISPDGQDDEHYPLKLERILGPREAVYAVRLPPSARDFSYRAWLDDGRTPHASEVRYAARPVVTKQEAWLVLPSYVGLRPKSKAPYELEQTRGEVVGLAGSSARVRVELSKPVRDATVELLGSTLFGLTSEVVLRRLPLALEEGGSIAVGTFDLRPAETTYRIVVKDEHEFENVPPPRRGIRVIPEDPPHVALLREEFRPVGHLGGLKGPDADFEVEGMPVPQGGRIRIAYACTGPYGVGHARLRFRVVRKPANPEDSARMEEKGEWLTLPLIEVDAPKDGGPFDVRRGVFARSGEDAQVQFFAVPSPSPESVLGRTQGGGRFDFESTGVPDGKGGEIDLLPGDQLEYYVEVFADRDPDARRPSARSETRRKTVVTVTELVRWLDETLQEERRIRQLETRQRGVFDGN
jgi:hypothetical protein